MSNLFKLVKSDYVKGLVMAALGAVVSYLYTALQGEGFNPFTAEVGFQMLKLAGTAAFLYLAKNFFTDANGKFLGKIG